MTYWRTPSTTPSSLGGGDFEVGGAVLRCPGRLRLRADLGVAGGHRLLPAGLLLENAGRLPSGRDGERVDQRDHVRPQLLEQLVDRPGQRLGAGRREPAVLEEPALVLLDRPQRVEVAQLVEQ